MEQIFRVFYDEKMTIEEKIEILKEIGTFLCHHYAMNNVADDLIDKLIGILNKEVKNENRNG